MESLQSILLVLHIIVAILIIVVVLLQPSGGGDGLVSSYSSGANFMSARATASFLTKVTMFLAIIFMGNTLALGIIATQKSQDKSIVNELIEEQKQEDNTQIPLE